MTQGDILSDLTAAMKNIGTVPPPLKFVSSHWMTVPGPEDWSDVRSPSRAARRRRQGHRQRIRQTVLPDPTLIHMADGTIVGHPETISRAMEAIAKKVGHDVREHQDRMTMDVLMGRNPW